MNTKSIIEALKTQTRPVRLECEVDGFSFTASLKAAEYVISLFYEPSQVTIKAITIGD